MQFDQDGEVGQGGVSVVTGKSEKHLERKRRRIGYLDDVGPGIGSWRTGDVLPGYGYGYLRIAGGNGSAADQSGGGVDGQPGRQAHG